MNMLSTLVTWQFLLLCLAISAIVYVFRTIIEYFLKLIKKPSSLWSDVILPILPTLLGGLMGWKMATFPYPDSLTNIDFRVIYGIVAGSLSGIVYRMVKATVMSKITSLLPATIPSASPPATSTTTVVIDNNPTSPPTEGSQ